MIIVNKDGARVLVVDDEPNITELVAMALRYEGFNVKTAATGRGALSAVTQFAPSLVILDVMLPDIDGIEVLKRMNSAGNKVPIIFLTAKDATEDKVHGLTIGGDDYVTKPFSIEELMARVRVVLRRHGSDSDNGKLSLADLELDDEAHEVRRHGHVVDLTNTEYRLLRYLLINAGRVLTRSQILDHVWHYDFGGDASVLETYISYLRRKVDRYDPPLVPAEPFTVAGTDGTTQFRMTDWREGRFGGEFVVLAVPLTEMQTTLRGLLVSQALVSIGVVVGTALLAFLIIEVGLRPLRRMGAVAGEIAAGDYSRRVEPATARTEIGRLGLALNAMLTQIEAAFDQRTASERRLRRFIADASHELRTPLTSVRGYSEMLRRGAAESPVDADLARRRIEEVSVRMSALVDDMLLIARLDQGRPLETRPVDLQVIARDAATDARVLAPQREIRLLAPKAVVVSGDDTRLRQVVGNLVRNALVHTPTTTPTENGLATQNGTARLSVAEHGSGPGPD